MYGHLSANAAAAGVPAVLRARSRARASGTSTATSTSTSCAASARSSSATSTPGWRPPPRPSARTATPRRGPAACMVEPAELLTDRVDHADWAMFAKNGTDATTTLPDASPGPRPAAPRCWRRRGAYHGWPRRGAPLADGRRDRPRTGPTFLLHVQRPGQRAARGRRGRPERRRPRSSSRRSGTTRASTRRWWTRSSPGSCGRCATGSARRWSWTRSGPGSGCTTAAAGSRSAWSRT